MAKSRLAEILKQEYKTKGVVGGAVSAVGKSLKEKMDFRNVLFGGSGVGSIIGRKIFGKGYSASPESSVVSKITSPEQTFSSEAVTVLSTIATHSATSAKNSIVLPSMARDMHLVKQNIAKLVRLGGDSPQTTAGDWLSRQMARENAYEESLKGKSTSPTPAVPVKKEDKKDTMMSRVFEQFNKELQKTIGPLKQNIENLLTSTVTGIAKLLGTVLTGPGFIGVLVAGAMAALYKSKSNQEMGELNDLSKIPESQKTPEQKARVQELQSRSIPRNEAATADYEKTMRGEFATGMEEDETLPPKVTTPTPVRTDGATLLNKVMDKEGVTDPAVRERITKLAMVESSMNPNATGPTIQSGMHKGDQARGLLQIMPKTAPEVGFKAEDLNDPEKAATAGVRYFLKNFKKFNGNLDAATVAHHAGPGGAEKYLATGTIGTKDVATGISTMGYLNKVSGTTLASASTSVSEGQRQQVATAAPTVVVDNSTKTNNMSSPQTVQVASAYNDDFTRLLQQVAGA